MRSHYGLGTASGQLKITSPDGDPLTVNYTVDTRQPRWVIWFLAAIGLVLGFVVRVLWQQRIEKNRALLALNAVLRHIASLRGRFDHKPYQDDLTEIEEKIKATKLSKGGRARRQVSITDFYLLGSEFID